MAYPVAKSFAAVSGATIHAPPVAPSSAPAWVPPFGYFADVPMLNNAQDVTPTIYQASDAYKVFSRYNGSAFLGDYSALGAQAYYGAGHESSSAELNIQLALTCDFSSLLWHSSNAPVAANAASVFSATTGLAPDGTPYAAHTYNCLQAFPASFGGSKSKFVFVGQVGVPSNDTWVYALDVDQPTNGYARIVTTQAQYSNPAKLAFNTAFASNPYLMTVIDEGKLGWWAAVNTGPASYLLFIAGDGTVTQYPALSGNNDLAGMIVVPSMDLLINIDGGNPSNGTAYRRLNMRNRTTGALTTSQTLGPVPGNMDYSGVAGNARYNINSLGLQWVEELGCAVGLDFLTIPQGPPTVVKLTPPASNPATGQWTWSTVAVQHWPSDTTGAATLQYDYVNSEAHAAFGKFRWIPALHAFVYCMYADRKPQIIRI